MNTDKIKEMSKAVELLGKAMSGTRKPILKKEKPKKYDYYGIGSAYKRY